jgi:hypothetical protein
MNHYPFLTYISLFSPTLPICIGISKITTIQRGMKILFFYLIVTFAADIFLMWFVRGHQLQVGLVHVYYLVEYTFIMLIISMWQESQRMKKYFQSLLLLYILFWVIAKITFEPFSGLYSISATTSQVFLTLGAGYTLFVVMGNREQPLMNNYHFWVLLSFVIYYAGTLLFIALRGILIQYSLEKLHLVASIDWSLKIFFNVLFAIGFLCPQTRT